MSRRARPLPAWPPGRRVSEVAQVGAFRGHRSSAERLADFHMTPPTPGIFRALAVFAGCQPSRSSAVCSSIASEAASFSCSTSSAKARPPRTSRPIPTTAASTSCSSPARKVVARGRSVCVARAHQDALCASSDEDERFQTLATLPLPASRKSKASARVSTLASARWPALHQARHPRSEPKGLTRVRPGTGARPARNLAGPPSSSRAKPALGSLEADALACLTR